MSVNNEQLDLTAQDEAQLKKNNKDILIGYITELRQKLEASESIILLRTRVEIVERNAIKLQQYSRRDTVEISNVPVSIKPRDLENKTLDILSAVGVTRPSHYQIHVCHRLKNDNVIIKFGSRKFADEALHFRKKITEIKTLENDEGETIKLDTNMYLKESMCCICQAKI